MDGTRPPNIQYMSMRQFAPEVELTTDPGFMICCDCKDNCSVSNCKNLFDKKTVGEPIFIDFSLLICFKIDYFPDL